jgi:hypothetical protein
MDAFRASHSRVPVRGLTTSYAVFVHSSCESPVPVPGGYRVRRCGLIYREANVLPGPRTPARTSGGWVRIIEGGALFLEIRARTAISCTGTSDRMVRRIIEVSGRDWRTP